LEKLQKKKKKKKEEEEEAEEEDWKRLAIQLSLDTFLQKQTSQRKIKSPVSLLHLTVSGLLFLFILLT
jgi:hypothetical protein